MLTANLVLPLSCNFTNAHLNTMSKISFKDSGYYPIKYENASIHSTWSLKSFENILAQKDEPRHWDVTDFNLSIYSPLISSN